MTVYLLSGPSGLGERADTYTLHWVNDQCYFDSGQATMHDPLAPRHLLKSGG